MMGEMDNGQLSVAVAQPLVRPGEVDENLRRMRPLIKQAAARGAELIVFSECALNGYDFDGLGLAARLQRDAPALGEVDAMARQFNLAIITGFYEQADDGVYNTAVAVRPDGSRVYQRKHIAADPEATDSILRNGPRRRTTFEWRGMKLAMVICADDRIENLYEELTRDGFDAAVLLTAGCGRDSSGYAQQRLNDPKERDAYLAAAESVCFPRTAAARVLRHNLAVIAVNQAGYVPERGYFHPGHSFVLDRTGRLAALIPGRFILEHLAPELAIGTITARPRPTD